jgi:hypothetical protein
MRRVSGCAMDHETGEIVGPSLAANDAGIADRLGLDASMNPPLAAIRDFSGSFT